MSDSWKGLLPDLYDPSWLKSVGAKVEQRSERCEVCKKQFIYNAVIYPSGNIEAESLPAGYNIPDPVKGWVWICDDCANKPRVKRYRKELERYYKGGRPPKKIWGME
jgi:hypothetical protein